MIPLPIKSGLILSILALLGLYSAPVCAQPPANAKAKVAVVSADEVGDFDSDEPGPDGVIILKKVSVIDGTTGKVVIGADSGVNDGIKDNTSPTTWLGVKVEPVPEELGTHLGLEEGEGLIVRGVPKASPASAAGLKVNDVLLRLDDQVLKDAPQLTKIIAGKKAGTTVTLTALRKGKEMNIQATLGEKAPGAGSDEPEISLMQFSDLNLDQALGESAGKHGHIIIRGSSQLNDEDLSKLPVEVQKAIEEAMKRTEMIQKHSEIDEKELRARMDEALKRTKMEMDVALAARRESIKSAEKQKPGVPETNAAERSGQIEAIREVMKQAEAEHARMMKEMQEALRELEQQGAAEKAPSGKKPRN